MVKLVHFILLITDESKQRKKTVILLCLKDLTVPCPSCTYNAASVPGSLQFWLPYLLFPSSWCEHKPPKQETITLQLYLAASNFDCLTFFSHQVGVNTSHRSKKLSTSTASATCHSRFVNNAIFPSIYNVLSISSIMQIEVCHWIQVCNYFLLPPLYQHKIANID